MRQDLEKWMTAACRKVYSFPIRGKGMAIREEKYTEGKFTHPPHPKDRSLLPDCKDPRARRLLEFLVPIFYLEKLMRVTVTIGNTNFGAYIGEREDGPIDWALMMRNMVKRLLAGIGKSKPTPICPYLLYLYVAHDAIQLEDKKVYMVGESCMRHNVKSDEEEQLIRKSWNAKVLAQRRSRSCKINRRSSLPHPGAN